MKIRKATAADLQGIAAFYDEVIDGLEAGNNAPKWKKGNYPTIENAETGLAADGLFLAEENGCILGSFMLRHTPEAGYSQADWGVHLPDDQVYVIYTLAVHPSVLGQGIGKKMMQYIELYAKMQGIKALRLDVVEGNLPAIALYERVGYERICRMDLGYSAYGLDWFFLYQKVL